MPYGTTQELMGSSIDPRLFVQDYSGYGRAADIQAAGVMGMTNTLGSAVADYTKQQKEAKNILKASQAQIEAAATLFPDQADYLGKIGNELKNEDVPISERAAMASQVADIINMGVGQKRYETELSFKRQDQENQNRESSMRQWAYGQQVAEAENVAAANQLDKKNKATIGPALLESVLKIAPAGIADNVRKSMGDYSPEEKFSLASSVMSLIPKSERKTAPTVQDVAVPGGTQKMQWDETSGTWIPIQTSIAPTQGAKVTTFGAANDPYLDSNSAKGIGAFGKLEPNDIALSPDMEKEVRAKGIKPGDTLSVTMENGDIVKGRWMDRTAQDSDVSSGKIKGVDKPLRGRVDFYTPGGVNPYDGMSVSAIGFTPTDAAMSPTEKIAVEKRQEEIQAAAAKESAAAAEAKGFVATLDELEKHPGFSNLFGSNLGVPTWIPGSSGADAKAILGKVQGKAFLEAIQKMKGMGALSEKEGETATKAYSALTPSMSEEAAKKEIATLKGILQAGINKSAAMTTAAEPPPVDPIQAASMKLQGLIPR